MRTRNTDCHERDNKCFELATTQERPLDYRPFRMTLPGIRAPGEVTKEKRGDQCNAGMMKSGLTLRVWAYLMPFTWERRIKIKGAAWDGALNLFILR